MTSTRSIVFVTGGNTGIGYEAVKALLTSDKAYHILMGSRSLDKANSAIKQLKSECPNASNTVEPIQVDLTSDESIEKAFDQVKADSGKIDTLVNNAGAAFDFEWMAGRVSLRDNFMLPYNTNLAGTHVLTYTFMPLLLKSSDPRLLFISGLSGINQASESYYPTPPLPAGWPKEKNYFETIGYRCTKVALNMLMLDWNHKLKDDGVKVWGVQPGFLITGLGGENVDKEVVKKMGAGHPSEGGAMIKRVVEGEFDDRTGALVGKAGVGRY